MEVKLSVEQIREASEAILAAKLEKLQLARLIEEFAPTVGNIIVTVSGDKTRLDEESFREELASLKKRSGQLNMPHTQTLARTAKYMISKVSNEYIKGWIEKENSASVTPKSRNKRRIGAEGDTELSSGDEDAVATAFSARTTTNLARSPTGTASATQKITPSTISITPISRAEGDRTRLQDDLESKKKESQEAEERAKEADERALKAKEDFINSSGKDKEIKQIIAEQALAKATALKTAAQAANAIEHAARAFQLSNGNKNELEGRIKDLSEKLDELTTYARNGNSDEIKMQITGLTELMNSLEIARLRSNIKTEETHNHQASWLKNSKELPKFFGNINENLDQWMFLIEQAMSMHHISDFDKLNFVTMYLRGNALQTLRKFKQDHFINPTWSE